MKPPDIQARTTVHNGATRSNVSTLADVAKHADVSTATVSRCLNAPDRVSEDTRKRVLQAVRDLGYSPNFGARALAARRTNTVGAVIPTMDNAIFARGIQAFQEELGRHRKTLLIASSGYREDVEEDQIRTLVARGAEALLLIGYHRKDSVYAMLEKRGVPALITWAYQADAPQSSIGFNNMNAMAGLARLALSQGHKRIAFISAPIADNDRAGDRVAGARLAMTEAGLDASELILVETPYGIGTGDTAFREIMATPTPPSLVLCGNDVLAVGALKAAKAMGLAVPQDVSITGFDDIELAILADPALTTVHVPHRAMGKRAAALIVELSTEHHPTQSVELKTEIIMRELVGPSLVLDAYANECGRFWLKAARSAMLVSGLMVDHLRTAGQNQTDKGTTRTQTANWQCIASLHTECSD